MLKNTLHALSGICLNTFVCAAYIFFPFSYHLIHLQISQSALVGVTDLTYDLFKYFIWPTGSVITNVKDNIFKIVLSSNGDDLRDFKKQKNRKTVTGNGTMREFE